MRIGQSLVLAAVLGIAAPQYARAQCYGWPVTCTGVTPGPTMPGGIGAGAALGIGLGIFGLMQEMQEPPTPAPIQPNGNSPGQPSSSPNGWNPAPPNSTPASEDIAQKKAAVLRQLRPLQGGSYSAAPAEGARTTDQSSGQSADFVSRLRPLDANNGAVDSAPTQADIGDGQRAAVKSIRGTAADQLCAAAGRPAGCITGREKPAGPAQPRASTPNAIPAVQTPRPSTEPSVPAAYGVPPLLGRTGQSESGEPPGTVSCDQVLGFRMQGREMYPVVLPCAGTDEALSEAARLPFDTAGLAAGSQTNPPRDSIPLANPRAAMRLLAYTSDFPTDSNGLISQASLNAEVKRIGLDACTRLGGLQAHLAGYRTALERLRPTKEMLDEEKAEWKHRSAEALTGAAKDVADALLGALEWNFDKDLETLDKQAARALADFRGKAGGLVDRRVSAEYRETRDLYDQAFKTLHDRAPKIAATRRALAEQYESVLNSLTMASQGVEQPDLWLEEGQRTRALEALRQLLLAVTGSPAARKMFAVTPVVGQAVAIGDVTIRSLYDLSNLAISYSMSASLGESSKKSTEALALLQKKIRETKSGIEKAQKEIARTKQACPNP